MQDTIYGNQNCYSAYQTIRYKLSAELRIADN